MNVVVDYEKVLNIVREEMELTRRSDVAFADLKLVIEDERLLAKEMNRSPDTIYIQVRFGAASTNFGQAILPFSMEVIGINQDIELTQKLLNDFVNTYNQLPYDDMTQFFLTPVVSQNNIPIYEGYRSMFIVSATFVIGNQLVTLDKLQYKISDGKYEDIEVISYADSTENDLHPQPLPNSYGKAKSYGAFQTYAFFITTYPDSNKQLIKDIYAWKFDRTIAHANQTFIFSGSFSKINVSFTDWEFKCKSADITQKIGEQPVITIAFAL